MGLQLVIWRSIIRCKIYAFVQTISQFEFKFKSSWKAMRTPPPHSWVGKRVCIVLS